ncbi:SDR family oxidoreductase [Prauserella cavernicola]|uniref:SDR family oxidoreductase n=1 Tax=Prauserella cavernicola TaxID=2800127 RepID=A0A934QPN6_9PSEU|nr:SDR family oxidoreductase [Prauserella cavernicola]MBK1783872.1 SDR family oxidoreductase [Prauserella cavernicola]
MTAPVSLVLAGTRGLGFAIAGELLKRGHRVAIASRSEDNVRDAVEQLGSYGEVIGHATDVRDESELAGLVERTRSELGPVTTLVANAGGPTVGGFESLDEDDWNSAYQLNLLSVVRSIRLVLPDMRAAGSGRIVATGSSSVRRPLDGLTLSNVFRPAVNGLVKDLAVQLAPERITVNMVSAGRIDTDRVRRLDQVRAERAGLDAEAFRANAQSAVPAGRYGTPDEFAAMVGFLVSPEAAYVTGQSVLIDGGLVPTLP